MLYGYGMGSLFLGSQSGRRLIYQAWDCFPQIRLDLGYLLTQAVNPHKRKAATFYLQKVDQFFHIRSLHNYKKGIANQMETLLGWATLKDTYAFKESLFETTY